MTDVVLTCPSLVKKIAQEIGRICPNLLKKCRQARGEHNWVLNRTLLTFWKVFWLK